MTECSDSNSNDPGALPPRLAREVRTVKAMIKIFCRTKHEHQNDLCNDCEELFHYARKRISNCPHDCQKPTCAQCQIHCFNEMRKKDIKTVMRFAGPRMLWKHPILSIMHMMDKTRNC